MELFDAPSDYGTSGLASLADAQSSQTQFDNQAEQAIQNVLADVGTRSNVVGSVGYDPRFAQAFNLSRGLIAGNKFDNQEVLNSLKSKIESNLEETNYNKTNVKAHMTSWNFFNEDEDVIFFLNDLLMSNIFYL